MNKNGIQISHLNNIDALSDDGDREYKKNRNDTSFDPLKAIQHKGGFGGMGPGMVTFHSASGRHINNNSSVYQENSDNSNSSRDDDEDDENSSLSREEDNISSIFSTSSLSHKGHNRRTGRPPLDRSKKRRKGEKNGHREEEEEPEGKDRETLTLEEIIQFNNEKKSIEKTAIKDDINKCFGCRYGLLVKFHDDSEVVGGADFNDVINKIIRQSTSKVQTSELLRSIKTVYDSQIRPYYKSIRKDPGEWSIEEIREHFFEHLCDPALDARRKIDDLNALYKIAIDNVVYRDVKSRRLKINKESLKSISVIQESLRRIYYSDTKKSFAFDENMTLSSASRGIKSKGISGNKNLKL